MKNKKNKKLILPALQADECVVEFDNNSNGTYLAGDLMSGKIIFVCISTKSLNGVKLNICGEAWCGWRKTFGINKPVTEQKLTSKKRTKWAQQDLFQWNTFLMGSKDGPAIEIPAKTAMTFNFAFQLAQNCPGSFEGRFGYVRYLLRVTIIHSDEREQSREVKLTVQPVLDLNKANSLLKHATTKESSQNMCYIPPNNLVLRVDLPKSAYVFGEIIPVTVTCRNSTSLICKHIYIMLKLNAKYTTFNNDSMREKIILTKLASGPVLPQESRTFVEAIRVPTTPVTCDNICQIVQISYSIHVATHMQYFMRNISAEVPITIGNVPYIGNDAELSASNTTIMRVVRANASHIPNDLACGVSNSSLNIPEDRG